MNKSIEVAMNLADKHVKVLDGIKAKLEGGVDPRTAAIMLAAEISSFKQQLETMKKLAAD